MSSSGLGGLNKAPAGVVVGLVQDMVRGEYHLPWEHSVHITDGTPCGFPPPERKYGA